MSENWEEQEEVSDETLSEYQSINQSALQISDYYGEGTAKWWDGKEYVWVQIEE